MTAKLLSAERQMHSRNITVISWMIAFFMPLLSFSSVVAWGLMAGIAVLCAAMLILLFTTQIIEAIRESRYL